LNNNVSLLQAEQNILISEFSLKASKSGYLPSIGLNGSYGWNQNNNNQAAFVAVSTVTGISGTVNLTWNLFDGGNTVTRVRNSKLALENQRILKDQLQLNIERDFNNAWTDYQNKLNIFNIQESNIKTARNNFERTEEKFRLGQVTSIEFRQAQQNLLAAELTRNQAKYDAKLAEVLVLQLSGELLNVNIF
jgi:outer membrane protein TolC